MVSTDPNVITVKGDDDSYQEDTGVATGTITPGQILERNGTSSSGATDETQVQRNSSDGVNTLARIALSGYGGKTISDDYSDGDAVVYRVFEPGEVAYIPIFDGDNAGGSGTDTSDNADISEDDFLVPYSGSGEDGNFRAFDSTDGDTEGVKMFQALEAVDNSGGSDIAYIRAQKV